MIQTHPLSTDRLGACLVTAPDEDACPIHLVSSQDFEAFRSRLSPFSRNHLMAVTFLHRVGQIELLPGEHGQLDGVILCEGEGTAHDPLLSGKLPPLLPRGLYRFAERPANAELATLAFLLGTYRFTRYKPEPDAGLCRLQCPEGVDARTVLALAKAICTARDLINTPASDLGPEALSAAAFAMAEAYGAACETIVGQDLLDRNFPMIHAVGRAAVEAPRLVDFTWGDPDHPKVTLVGKSVCFDTGGLNLKPDASMLLMKKDMGGGAIALGIAGLVMELKLPVRLRVLLPIVENSVSSASFRPGDVLRSRSGLSVEIGNTDAEGRLILADALALADEESPDILIDFATLTGAARVALGPEISPFFTDDDRLAAAIDHASKASADASWRLPLWNGYDTMLTSKIADLNHIGGGPFAGAIMAALFLRRFVRKTPGWIHFDVYGWNPSTKPGRPEGGEGQLIRLVHALLVERYGHG